MNIRKLFRPLIRQIHPDLNSDAPKHIREMNAKSLAHLHAFIDVIETNNLKLSPRYDLSFGIKNVETSDWRVQKSTMTFPTSLLRASVGNRTSSASLQVHIQEQVNVLLREMDGTQSRGEKKVSFHQQRKKMAVSASQKAVMEDKQESEKRVHKNFSNMLRYMAHKQAILPTVKTFLEYLYGLPPGTPFSSLDRNAASLSTMDGDAAEAAFYLSALYKSGRVLVDKDLSISEGTLALRRFGLICFKYHRQLQLTHPAWQKVVVILHGKADLSGEAPVSSKSDMSNYKSIHEGDLAFNQEKGVYGEASLGAYQFLPMLHTMDGVWYCRVPRNVKAMDLINHVAAVLAERKNKVSVENNDYEV